MGLDVSHLQLTLTPRDKDDFLEVKDWDLDCNVPLQNYSKYITTIDDFDHTNWLAIIENEKQFEKLKQTESFDWFEKVFIGALNDNMQKQLERYIVNQKLEKLERTQNSITCEGITYHLISFRKPVKVQGVYYVEVGHQRKGMSNLYYGYFKTWGLWGKKEDFDFAYACVGDEWYLEHWGQDAVNEMTRKFKEDFVDKFEFGKSLLDSGF